MVTMKVTIKQLKSLIREAIDSSGYNKLMEASLPIGDLSALDVQRYFPEAWAELEATQAVEAEESDDPPTPLEDCLFSTYVGDNNEVVLTFEDPELSGPGGVPLRWYPREKIWEP